MFGIESIIKKDPDVVLTVTDAAKAQEALTGAPGTLRVIDPRTVYLRMPPSFMEPETLLMVLKNLMRAAHDRAPAATAESPAVAAPTTAPAAIESPRSGKPGPAAVEVAAGDGNGDGAAAKRPGRARVATGSQAEPKPPAGVARDLE